MPSVNIPYVGVVEFPDTMSQDEISNVIKTQIMPNAPQANLANVAGSTKVADVLQKSIFSPIDAIMPGSNLANEPTPAVGSLAKGIKSLSNIPTEWQLSSQLELIAANKRKYGENFENAPEKEKADILNTVKKASENLTYLAKAGEDVKAIEQKYGKDPLSKKIDALEQKPEFKNASEWEQAGMIGKEYLKNIDALPSYIVNVGLSSLPQSIAMAVAARFGMAAGPTGGLIVGGGSSAMMEYGQQYVDLREQGFSHEEANNKAMVKSSIIGAFDAASLRSAGKIAEKIFDNTAKKVFKETAKEVGKEIPKQAALGAAGEGLGSYASNQPVNPRAVFEEAIGEVFGAPGEAAATYRSKKAEAEQAQPPKLPPNAPEIPPAGTPPSEPAAPVGGPNIAPPTPGLVEEGDLEEPAALIPPKQIIPPSTPPKGAEQEVIDPELKARASMRIDQLLSGVAPEDINVRELNKLARDLDIEPSKAPIKTAAEILDKLGKQETAPPKAPEAIPPIDMGENTEYRIVKNDNGWTAVLVDNDANQMVSATTFPTDKFGDEKGKEKAIEYAKNEQEKAKPYITEEAANAPEEFQAPVAPEEKPEGVQVSEEPSLEQAQQAIDSLIEEPGNKVMWPAPPPLTPEQIAEANRARQAAQREAAQGVAPTAAPTVAPEAAALSPEAQADKDFEDALADLAWLATKPTRMNMMPEDEQRLMPVLIKLMDAAFRKGYHTFKKAAKFVRDMIRERFGKDVSDKINLNHLQGAYIAMSGNYPDKATPIAEVAGVQKLEELEKELPTTEIKTEEVKPSLSTPEGKFKVAQEISKHFLGNKGFKTIVEARKFISDLTGEKIEAATNEAKQADEAVEVGVVLAAQNIIKTERSSRRLLADQNEYIYARLLALYQDQPNLAIRSSESIREQAYSTPAPLAFVASQLAGINQNTTVYEPTAGNGMLVIEAVPNKTILNEINSSRSEMLKKVMPDAKLSIGNALKAEVSPQVDVVIENPPFGATGENFDINGFKTRELDHAIAMKSLESMKDNGMAVLIVGGVRAEGEDARREGYRSPAKRNFYFNLYKKYNVVDHFTVAGNMYSKQGASYPVDVILISGRADAYGSNSLRQLPAAQLPKVFNSYDELREKLNERSLVSNRNVSPIGPNSSEPTAGDGGKRQGVDRGVIGEGGGNGAEGTKPAAGSGPSVSETKTPKGGRPEPTGTEPSAGELRTEDKLKLDNEGRPIRNEGAKVEPRSGEIVKGNEPGGVGGTSTISGTRTESGLADRRGKEEETAFQVAYDPNSKANSVGTLVPNKMAQYIKASLDKLEREVGNIDDYVANALQMNRADVIKNFSGEQVDALGLAIYNAEQGNGFIIGDQTGIGKGRVVAGMIRYALKQGQIPTFVTEKTGLYTDMVRDLDDIGMTEELGLDTQNPKILMTNRKDKIPYVLTRTNKEGDSVEHEFELKPAVAYEKYDSFMNDMVKNNDLGKFKVIFTTYDQLTPKGQKLNSRQELVKHFGNNNYMIFDESHNAGGSGNTKDEKLNRATFFRQLVANANGTFFSSATYAKRPDVMDLYSSTNMKLAVDNLADLGDAIKNGGIPMQQVVANMLAEDGQYIRRERTFAGIKYDTKTVVVNKETAENMASAMRMVLAFSRAKGKAVTEMKKDLDQQGGAVRERSEKHNITSANFGSTMHNLISQMLLSLKSVEAVKFTKELLKNGERPVLTVSNTMGSFFKDFANEFDIKSGDPMNLTFKDLYDKYLEKQRWVTIKPPGGIKPYKYYLTDQDLGEKLVEQFHRIKQFINEAGFGDAPISPIDYMIEELKKDGYTVDEITGRTAILNYATAVPTLASRTPNPKQRNNAIRGFNNGKINVLILNQSGSTGISLHASSKVKDQNKRHMVLIQPEADINKHVQMLGRVNRTGQVIVPEYTQMMADIPAEQRIASNLLKKMASLNANTTASKKSAVTSEVAVDFMNDYGGQIAQEYLRDNPDVWQALDEKVTLKDSPEEGTEDDIRELTGYIPILPIKQQEEIYKDLIERYNDLIERENSMGTNKLETKAVDLDAKVLSSKPITEDKGSESIFASPANMERVDVKRTVKPYSKAEVEEQVQENLNGLAPKAKVTELRESARARSMEFLQQQIPEMEENGVDPVKVQAFKDKINSEFNNVQTILQSYPLGTPLSIKNRQDMLIRGVVTNVENKKKTKDPVAGSDWKMTIALADGDAKSISLNFSQIGNGYDLREEITTNWLNPETGKGEWIDLKDIFDKGAVERREKRWIVTGNLLAGYSAVQNKGQILSFTREDGTTAQGVLMPRSYDFEKEQKEAPVKIKTAENAIRFMDEAGGTVVSPDGVLRISKYGNQYQFSVPKSKKLGATYYDDNGLLKHIGYFNSSGSNMYVRLGNWQTDRVKGAIDYILSERGETLLAGDKKQKAREMFEPKPLESLVPKTNKQKFNEEFRNRFIAQANELKTKRKNLIRKVKEGETNIDVQREMTFLDETLADIEKNIKLLKEPTLRTAESIYNKARKDHFENKIISKEVFDVIQWMYNNAPALLNGLQLSVRLPKTAKEKEAYGGYNSLNRLMTLFKGTSGVTDPETLRHELTHTLEEMMTPQVKLDLIRQWAKDVKQAMKKYTDADSQAFLQAVNDYMANPSTATYDEVRRHYKNEALYQFANPSEYWAVNAEKLFTMKMGTPWHRFVLAVKKLIEGMKSVLGFNSQYVLYKTFDDLMTGKYPRDQVKTIRHFFEMGISNPSILENLKKLDETDELLAKHNRNDAPIHMSNTVMDKLLGGFQDAKNIGAKLKESPRLAVNNMVGNVDRALLATRINTIDFTAGLTAADAERYGRMLVDSEGRAIASVAMNQALKAARIGTQVIMMGKLVFDPNIQMFRAVKDKFSMANILTIKHQLEKRVGVQRTANVIQAYFEAKRSKSINQEYADRLSELEDLRSEQMDPGTSIERQLKLLQEVAEAEDNFRSITIALQKVNMTEEAIEDFIKLEKEYPELKEMMKNWNAVNQNMINMMEQSRIISKKRADTLRDIEDYVPWQRIQDEQSDPHTPIYGSKGVRNISREHRFKEGKVTADIDDIVDNMLHNVMTITRNSIKNYAANRIAVEYGVRNEKGKLKVFPKEDFAKGIVSILMNGRKVNIQITDPLIARAAIGIEHIQIPMNEILSFFSNALRRSITFSGVFQVKQLFMDAPTAALVSGVKNPVKLYGSVFGSFIKSLTPVAMKPVDYLMNKYTPLKTNLAKEDPIIQYLRSYGIGGYHSSARTAEHQYRQEIGLLNESTMSKAASILDRIADASDLAQRRAVFIRVMKETKGDTRAAVLAATNVIDFDKRGDGRTAQALNRTIAFMNAYAQQIDVLAQALAEPVAYAVEKTTGAKVTSVSGKLRGLSREQAMTRLALAGGLLAMTCISYALLVGDDDEYKRMDDQTKMRNFVIPRRLMKNIGYDHTLLLPMHTSASYFFKSIPELLTYKMLKDGTKDAVDNTRLISALKEGAVDALLGPLGSGPIPTGFKPVAEIALNHNFFTGGNVTPQGMKNVEAFRQYTMSTSELGKWFSAASQIPFTGKTDSQGNPVEGSKTRILNPLEADHLMRGLAGSVAGIAMWGSNLFSGNRAAQEERNNPLYGSFIAPEVPRGREDLFYDLKQRSETAMGTFKDLAVKQNPKEAKQWLEVNKGLIQAYGFTEGAGKALQAINANMRRISDDKQLTSEEKRKQLDEYKMKKDEILQDTIKFRFKAGL